MDEYSSLGPGMVILPPADRVLKVSPKRGPGDQRGKRKRVKQTHNTRSAQQGSAQDRGVAPETDEADQGKGIEVDIVI